MDSVSENSALKSKRNHDAPFLSAEERLERLRAIRGLWRDKPALVEDLLAMRSEVERGTSFPE